MATMADSIPFYSQLVGRKNELTHITQLLTHTNCRLLTLLGPGGIGKTHLAWETLHKLRTSFPDGVYFTPLQSLNSPDYIIAAVAGVIGFNFSAGGEPQQQLFNYLRKKKLLLVLDNFEHLLDGAGIIHELIAFAPHISLLVTSRERLNLSSETVFPLTAMSIPQKTDRDMLAYEAAELFIQKAQQLNPAFSIAASEYQYLGRICHLTGGMPLAILLAASWVSILSLREIALELERGLDLLEADMRDLPQRHRSIRWTFDHSWRMLSDHERDVFKKLSIFRGGFTREAAEAVAGASLKTLSRLVNKSLLGVRGEGRYDLHELLRQYAEEKLEQSPAEQAAAMDAHCAFYAACCQQWGDDLRGPDEALALERIEGDLDNIRQGWDWAVEHEQRERIWQFLYSVSEVYGYRVRRFISRLMWKQALERLNDTLDWEDGLLQGVLLSLYAFDSVVIGEMVDEATLHKALQLMMREGNRPVRRATQIGYTALGICFSHLGWLSEAEKVIDRGIAIYRTQNHDYELAELLTDKLIYWHNNWVDEFALLIGPVMDELLALMQRLKSPILVANITVLTGALAYHLGNFEEAKKQLESYIAGTQDGHQRSARLILADVLFELGEYDEAECHCTEQINALAESGTSPWNLISGLITLAKIWKAKGQQKQAAELLNMLSHKREAIWSIQKHYSDIKSLLAVLEAELPTEVYAAAVERGKARDLDTFIDDILAEFKPTPENAPSPDQSLLIDPLTERELQVLCLLAAGRSNRQIAAELWLALGTVKRYVSDIFSKLGVTSRTQAITRGRELNLLP